MYQDSHCRFQNAEEIGPIQLRLGQVIRDPREERLDFVVHGNTS
jgi:hypothetical protein